LQGQNADEKEKVNQTMAKSKSSKIAKVMREYKAGELHSGSKKGPIVQNPAQAKAIALSEARAAGAKIPKTKKKK